jgi:hypothetical protein
LGNTIAQFPQCQVRLRQAADGRQLHDFLYIPINGSEHWPATVAQACRTGAAEEPIIFAHEDLVR